MDSTKLLTTQKNIQRNEAKHFCSFSILSISFDCVVHLEASLVLPPRLTCPHRGISHTSHTSLVSGTLGLCNSPLCTKTTKNPVKSFAVILFHWRKVLWGDNTPMLWCFLGHNGWSPSQLKSLSNILSARKNLEGRGLPCFANAVPVCVDRVVRNTWKQRKILVPFFPHKFQNLC